MTYTSNVLNIVVVGLFFYRIFFILTNYFSPIFTFREKLVESSMKATKNFSVADWCKNFEVSFINEEVVSEICYIVV